MVRRTAWLPVLRPFLSASLALTLAFSLDTLSHPLLAQSRPDSRGTEFWLAFPGNYVGGSTMSLFIAGDVATTGTVEIPGLAFSTAFSVTPGTVTTVTLPAAADIQTSDLVEAKGVHVVANAEVTVYGLSRIPATTDAYLGLPVDILGTEYFVMAYPAGSAPEFAIVGAADGTAVTITPTVAAGTRAAGVPYTINLNAGETYQLRSVAGADLTGTTISSTQPVALFGGNQCATVPPGVFFCDHVVEQIPATVTWGRSFVTVPLATRLNGDTFRILASTDATAVSINGTLAATLDAGEVLEQIIAGPSQITSDKPILLAQFSNGTAFDNVTSDPFMMLVPPTEQFLGSYTVTTPATGFTTNFINVAARSEAVGNIILDGTVIPASAFTAIGSSGYSAAQVPVGPGTHTLSGTLPFGVFVYGFDVADSYGYPGGTSLAPVVSVTAIDLQPESATNPVGTEHCVTATVTDESQAPLAGIRVDFSVSGANEAEGFDVTGEVGTTQFCYTGMNGGDDTIQASVGAITDAASKSWTVEGGGGEGEPVVKSYTPGPGGQSTNTFSFDEGNNTVKLSFPNGVLTPFDLTFTAIEVASQPEWSRPFGVCIAVLNGQCAVFRASGSPMLPQPNVDFTPPIDLYFGWTTPATGFCSPGIAHRFSDGTVEGDITNYTIVDPGVGGRTIRFSDFIIVDRLTAASAPGTWTFVGLLKQGQTTSFKRPFILPIYGRVTDRFGNPITNAIVNITLTDDENVPQPVPLPWWLRLPAFKRFHKHFETGVMRYNRVLRLYEYYLDTSKLANQETYTITVSSNSLSFCGQFASFKFERQRFPWGWGW